MEAEITRRGAEGDILAGGRDSQSKTVYFRDLIAAGHACGYLELPNDSGACRPSWTCLFLDFFLDLFAARGPSSGLRPPSPRRGEGTRAPAGRRDSLPGGGLVSQIAR